MHKSAAIYLGLLTFLSGCAPRTARVPVPPPNRSPNSDYIDIQAGWRLTAVTPILKSGGYVLKSLDQHIGGNAITLSADPDFIGYEVAHYAVIGQRSGRVRVEFSSAEVSKDGKNGVSFPADCSSISTGSRAKLFAAHLFRARQPGRPQYGRDRSHQAGRIRRAHTASGGQSGQRLQAQWSCRLLVDPGGDRRPAGSAADR